MVLVSHAIILMPPGLYKWLDSHKEQTLATVAIQTKSGFGAADRFVYS